MRSHDDVIKSLHTLAEMGTKMAKEGASGETFVKTRSFVSKTRNCVLTTRNLVLKMMNFAAALFQLEQDKRKPTAARLEDDGIGTGLHSNQQEVTVGIKIDGFWSKNDGFCIEKDGFCI